MLLSVSATAYLFSWLTLRLAYGFEEPGLYDDSRVVAYLDHTNFYNVTMNSGRAWLVQFYNSWCGHCMDFAPIYQEFARNVSGWRPAVGIAAINCADEKNIAVCRANKIEAYPTMKAGPPNATSTTDFSKVTVKQRTPALLIEMLLKYLLSIPYHLPGLHPLGSIDKLWETLDTNTSVSQRQSAIFLLEEGPDSYIGSRIIMDTFGGTGLTVFRNVNNDLTDVQIQKVDVNTKTLNIVAKNLDTYEAVAAVLHPHLVLSNESLAEYMITRKPKQTVRPMEMQKVFTDEEIMEQVAELRASRKNISTTEQAHNSSSTVPSPYIASLQQRGFLVTMEEYREAVVLAWRKRLNLQLSKSALATTQQSTLAERPSSDAGAPAPAITPQQSSALLRPVINHIADLIMPKNVPSVPAVPAAGVDGAVAGDGGAATAAAAAIATSPAFNDVLQQLDVVQLSDLLFAVRKSVGYEIPLRLRDDDAAQLAAAKQYVKVLAEFLPCPALYRSSLHCLGERLDATPRVTSSNWIELLQECQLKDALDRDSALASCKGSTSRYRGYPCTMWTMFHTLTVAEADVASRLPKGRLARPRVLVAMRDYMGSFFGCSECAHHFLSMATALNLTAAAPGDESILWLWSAHNHANARLRGAQSEDPEHRKQQYPPVELCSSCFQSIIQNGSGSPTWRTDRIVLYLKSHYGWSSIVGLPGQAIEQPALPALPVDRPVGIRLPPPKAPRGDLFERLRAAAQASEPSAVRVLMPTVQPGGQPRKRWDATNRLYLAGGLQQQEEDTVHTEQHKPTATIAGGRFRFRTHEQHRRSAEQLEAVAVSYFHSFSSSDLAVIALLYTFCGIFIAVFYYYFVVSRRMRIKLM